MRPDLSALRRDAEALPEGPEKQEALSSLDQLAKDIEETDRLVKEQGVHEAAQRSGRRRAALLITLPLACVPIYFAISGILTGKSPITFQRGIEYIYWHSDPHLFGFVIGFIALVGLVILYLALVPIFTGEEASGVIIGAPNQSSQRTPASGRR